MGRSLPLTVTDAAARLRAGETTSVELTSAFLARADRLDPKIGTYVTRFDDLALAAATVADECFAKGIDRGPLQGIPVGVKDILAMRAGPTTANSLVLDPSWGAGKQAPVVERLLTSGAVITGKTTTYEFAIGPPDGSKPFAIARNPWHLPLSTGGSSAGTANGIAAGLFLAGIGTDTGGSIRGPAAWNGITGFKPTYGRVPKSGCVPLAYSLDHIGPMARSARDCAAVLLVIAGHDPSDESSVDRPVDNYLRLPTGDLDGIRIGVVREHHFPDDADPALVSCFDAALDRLTDLGAQLVEVRLPWFEEVCTALWVTVGSEALAYHLQDLRTHWNDYNVITRINIARGALSSGADYVQAGRVRRMAQRQLAKLFAQVDLIATPTSAIGAPTHEEVTQPRVERSFKTVFTGYWDAVGNPAIALPMGATAEGLPLSLQFAGRPFEDALVLRAGEAYQSVTDWHLRIPELLAELLAAEP